MIVGYLLIGTLTGVTATVLALIGGWGFIGAIAAYFATSLLSVGLLVLWIAFRAAEPDTAEIRFRSPVA